MQYQEKILCKGNKPSSLNPVSICSDSEILMLLELGIEVQLSEEQRNTALSVMPRMDAEKPDGTLRDLVDYFLEKPELKAFALECERLFLKQ